MKPTVIKWGVLSTYVALSLWLGSDIACPSDDARPLILLLGMTPIVYINVCFFLRLPINLLYLPETSIVTNHALRRRVVLSSWLLTIVLVLWGFTTGFGCSV